MNDSQRILHIMEAINVIELVTIKIDKDIFLRDLKIKYACYGNLIIISEAATKISKETKIKCNKIEWDLITGFRNFIVHEYFRIDWNIVWDIIIENIPKMKIELNLFMNNII